MNRNYWLYYYSVNSLILRILVQTNSYYITPMSKLKNCAVVLALTLVFVAAITCEKKNGMSLNL